MSGFSPHGNHQEKVGSGFDMIWLAKKFCLFLVQLLELDLLRIYPNLSLELDLAVKNEYNPQFFGALV